MGDFTGKIIRYFSFTCTARSVWEVKMEEKRRRRDMPGVRTWHIAVRERNGR